MFFNSGLKWVLQRLKSFKVFVLCSFRVLGPKINQSTQNIWCFKSHFHTNENKLSFLKLSFNDHFYLVFPPNLGRPLKRII